MGEPVFGNELRSLRGQQSLSLRKLAKLVHYDPGYMSKVENGLKPPTRALAEACDEVLGSGTILSSLIPSKAASTSSRWTQDGIGSAGNGVLSPVANELLDMLTGLAVGQIVDRETLAELLERIIEAEAGSCVVDEWQEVAGEYGYRYLVDPREVLVADLARDLARLELLLAHQSDSAARRPLNDVGARLAALMAMACVDMGYFAEARRAWQLTRRRSNAEAQSETQLWVRGQEAILGLYSMRPLPVVLALAERGLAIRTANPSAGTAALLAAKAQTLSRQGRSEEALDTLDTLRATFERLPDTATGCTDSIFGWPERRLHHTASFVHAFTGPAPQADRAHAQALSFIDAAATDRRCQIEMHRATRLVRDGSVAEGLTRAATSLGSVPPERQGTFVLALAAGVLDHVPPEAMSHTVVVSYRDQLAASGYRRSAGATSA